MREGVGISLGALQPEDVEKRQALLSALEKAKRQAEEPPVEKQILATEEYLARAKKRLSQHDVKIAAAREALQRAEQNKEVDLQGIADGETLLQKLKTQVPDPTSPTLPAADPVGEVARLQQMVADLQRQLQQHGSPVVPQCGPVQESPLKRGRVLREDFVPHTDDELAQWMHARQSEMDAAIATGHTSEVCRLAALVAEGAATLKSWNRSPSTVSNMV